MHNDKTCGQSILTDSPTIHSLSIAPYFLLRPVPSQLSMKIHLRLSSNPDTCKTQLYVYRIVRLSHMHKHALCSRHQYCYELQRSESGMCCIVKVAQFVPFFHPFCNCLSFKPLLTWLVYHFVCSFATISTLLFCHNFA